MQKCWLRCKLSRGLYPDDFMVRIPDSQDHNHHDVVFFACKDFVKQDGELPKNVNAEIDGKVLVTFVEHIEMSAVVRLPKIEDDERIIAVPRGSIQRIEIDVHDRFGFVFQE